MRELTKAETDRYEAAQEAWAKDHPIGTTVKLIRTAETWENGWQNSWAGYDLEIGEEYTIESFQGKHGITVQGDGFSHPYFVFEKVEDPSRILVALNDNLTAICTKDNFIVRGHEFDWSVLDKLTKRALQKATGSYYGRDYLVKSDSVQVGCQTVSMEKVAELKQARVKLIGEPEVSVNKTMKTYETVHSVTEVPASIRVVIMDALDAEQIESAKGAVGYAVAVDIKGAEVVCTEAILTGDQTILAFSVDMSECIRSKPVQEFNSFLERVESYMVSGVRHVAADEYLAGFGVGAMVLVEAPETETVTLQVKVKVRKGQDALRLVRNGLSGLNDVTVNRV